MRCLPYALFAILAFTGCSSLLKTLDASYGAPGPEEMYGPSSGYVADRAPASVASGERGGESGSTWGGGAAEDEYTSRPSSGKHADAYVEDVSFSNTNYVKTPVKRQYRSGGRANRSDFIDDSSNEGSLWGSSGQTNYYFTKNKIRNLGDLLTLTIEQEIVREVSQEVRRTLSVKEKKVELLLAQERLRRAALGIEDPKDPGGSKAKTAVVAGRAPASPLADANKDGAAKKKDTGATPPIAGVAVSGAPEPMVPRATLADIDVAKSLTLASGENMLVEVINRYPNGNYRVRGTKRIPYRNGQRILKLAAIIRSTDVGDDDTITSGKLFEARYEVIR
ncbi:MAG: flagellar basal body L-ring protein FlgH [Bdellovibrionota bacterium]